MSVLAIILAAAALGPCADVSQCTVVSPPKLVEAATALGLTVKSGSTAQVAPITSASGDRAFALELDDEACVVRARSLHRPVPVYGLARYEVPRVGKKFIARATAATLKRALAAAMADLQARILESRGQGVRTLALSVQLSGLDRDARAHVQNTMLRCLEQQLELVGAVTTPREVGGFLEDRVEYAPDASEPREPLQWQVDRFRAALLGGPKAACTVLGTALQGQRVIVAVDEPAHGVIVTFKR